MSFKEDFNSKEFIADDIGDSKMFGALTREQVIGLRSGALAAQDLVKELEDSGKLEAVKAQGGVKVMFKPGKTTKEVEVKEGA